MSEKKEILEHIEEFRRYILKGIIVLIVFSIIGFLLGDRILNHVVGYLIDISDVKLIATHPLDIFYMKINVGIFVGTLVSLPVFLYEGYRFVKPGLTDWERRFIKFGVLFGFGLFVIGVLFGYLILLKVIVWFFSSMARPAGIENLWNINYFVSFVVFTCLLMGFVFQLPVIITVLLSLDVIDIDFLKENRGYVIIGMFTLAAVITPPDPVTQILVALPLIVLYEASIWVNKLLNLRKSN